jgi:catechol-2,3-dioxygenase
MNTPMTEGVKAGSMAAMTNAPLHPAVRVGHVHLRVVDIDRSLAFYRDALGLASPATAARWASRPCSWPRATTTTTSP